MNKPSPSDRPAVFKSAFFMGIAVFLSRISGLIREQVFAFLFGAGLANDAFQIAFRIPNLLRDLFAEGAMSASLVPVFTRTRMEEGDRRAWRVAGLVFRFLFVFVAALTLLGIAFAPTLVDLYAEGFRSVPGKFELTVELTRWLFPFFPLVALAAAYMAILNACGAFFLPSFASALFNLTSVAVGSACAWLAPRFGAHPILGMAYGVLAGGVVQAFCQLPQLYKKGYRWQGREAEDPVWYRDPALKRMLSLMLPGMVGLAATQINILVNSVLATSQEQGAVSWLNYAFRLMQFPIGIFGVSIASATLAEVSRLWVARDAQSAANTLDRSLRGVFAVNLPAASGLAFLGVPIIALIFQYGKFTASDTQATAMALMAYALGLTAYSAVKVVVPVCYALGNTQIPIISSFLSVVLNIVLNVWWVKSLGYWGLALGTSVAAWANALFLVFAVRRIFSKSGVNWKLLPLAVRGGVHTALALAMGAVCFWSFQRLGLTGQESALERLGWTLLLVLEGVFLVLFAAKLFRIKETEEILAWFGSRLARRLSGRKS